MYANVGDCVFDMRTFVFNLRALLLYWAGDADLTDMISETDFVVFLSATAPLSF